MTRKHFTALMVVLTIAAGWALIGGSQTPSNTTHVYFFVAPALLTDGSSSAAEIKALKEFLVETAGGYSGLGESEGGWKNLEGNIETETNHSFFVSCQKDISKELQQFMSDHFGQSDPYIITWEATSPDPLFTASVSAWEKRR
jgi:hypothetical protein